MSEDAAVCFHEVAPLIFKKSKMALAKSMILAKPPCGMRPISAVTRESSLEVMMSPSSIRTMSVGAGTPLVIVDEGKMRLEQLHAYRREMGEVILSCFRESGAISVAGMIAAVCMSSKCLPSPHGNSARDGLMCLMATETLVSERVSIPPLQWERAEIPLRKTQAWCL